MPSADLVALLMDLIAKVKLVEKLATSQRLPLLLQSGTGGKYDIRPTPLQTYKPQVRLTGPFCFGSVASSRNMRFWR